MILKNIVREVLIFLHLDVTKNLKYDRLTKIIMKNRLSSGSNCIDVGCHKGEILSLMLKYAPNGTHYAFEPIPYLYKNLKEKYGEKAAIFPYALSDIHGETTFQWVKNAPAYSGLKKRRYDISDPEIEEIDVKVRRLDEIIPANVKIDFIKIDVEGGEFGVIRGAREMLKRNKPLVLFECGKGASDYYGTTPSEIYRYIAAETGLKIYTLSSFINSKNALTEPEFVECFETNTEYYFVAK